VLILLMLWAQSGILILAHEQTAQPPFIAHDLHVTFNPQEESLFARDRVTVPDNAGTKLRFFLHKDLSPVSLTPGVHVNREAEPRKGVPIEAYGVTVPSGVTTFVIQYGGPIHHPVVPLGTDRTGGFEVTRGTISDAGVYLDGGSFWYPIFKDSLVTFTLHVTVPEKWDAVSQGERTSVVKKDGKKQVQWKSPEPQDEIYLVAGPFVEYARKTGSIDSLVFLRTADDNLAKRYLDATDRYLAMYEKLLGPYPFKKFALVENFWETGFGMPSFTLLGPKVIRFPFILYTSYPHEILHNWWGNSVYPDYGAGNWSEGLTAYLADHLIQEQRGRGASYRRDTLQKYADYVSKEKDFPLTQFKSRHSSASQAIGYGKALMFFHMLRQELGDKTFVKGLRSFYRDHKFRVASYDDLRRSLEAASGKDLKLLFDQWLTRTGAPELKLGTVEYAGDGQGFFVKGVLEQIQPGKAYHLRVPISVTMDGQDSAYVTWVVMNKKREEFKLRVPHKPLRIDVDPRFDLFRMLARGETPTALSRAFGAKHMLIVLPSKADPTLLEAYRKMAESWSTAGPDTIEVKLDSEVERLPSDKAITVLGWENRYMDDVVSALKARDVEIGKERVKIGDATIPRTDRSLAMAVDHPLNKNHALTWIATDNQAALPGLGRKLPHYGKYGYVAFQGNQPANVLKGRWSARDSALTGFAKRESRSGSSVRMGKVPRGSALSAIPRQTVD
jgi:aminopeptidase N